MMKVMMMMKVMVMMSEPGDDISSCVFVSSSITSWMPGTHLTL